MSLTKSSLGKKNVNHVYIYMVYFVLYIEFVYKIHVLGHCDGNSLAVQECVKRNRFITGYQIQS